MKLLLLSCVLAFALATPVHIEFFNWMQDFGRIYHSHEIAHKFECFTQTVKNIEQNRLNNPLAEFAHNEFSDLCPEEFAQMYLSYVPSDERFPDVEYIHADDMELEAAPASWDWDDHGATTPIKNQGQCGSCWAFSATEGVESGGFMTSKSLKVLAPQQIVDCDKHDNGCGGGNLRPAFNYVKSAGGMEAESSYPYQARNGQCKFDQSKVIASIKTAVEVGRNNEAQMLDASYAHGPLSICVDASSWSSYSGGVLTNCGKSLDHCVQAVGWGEQSGTKYWKVRNSWGAGWGLQGHILLAYGQDTCGMDQDPFYTT